LKPVKKDYISPWKLLNDTWTKKKTEKRTSGVTRGKLGLA